jgi:hypothetical protein
MDFKAELEEVVTLLLTTLLDKGGENCRACLLHAIEWQESDCIYCQALERIRQLGYWPPGTQGLECICEVTTDPGIGVSVRRYRPDCPKHFKQEN